MTDIVFVTNTFAAFEDMTHYENIVLPTICLVLLSLAQKQSMQQVIICHKMIFLWEPDLGYFCGESDQCEWVFVITFLITNFKDAAMKASRGNKTT